MPMLRYDATLRGVSLCSLADEIIVRDIVEMAPTEDRNTAPRAMHAGTRITSIVRRSLPIQIIFNIRAYDSTRRAEIMDKIAEWVGPGGDLTINTRPGKRLSVKPEKMPRLDSSLKWTADLSMTLTAYEQPYWEDSEETKNYPENGNVSINATWSENYGQYVAVTVIDVPGNLEKVPLCATFYANGDVPLTHIKIVADDTFFELDGISVGPGFTKGLVFIDYDESDTLRIRDFFAGVSLMANRTAESSDDLLVRCGHTNQLYAFADAPVQISFSTRGRWL